MGISIIIPKTYDLTNPLDAWKQQSYRDIYRVDENCSQDIFISLTGKRHLVFVQRLKIKVYEYIDIERTRCFPKPLSLTSYQVDGSKLTIVGYWVSSL